MVPLVHFWTNQTLFDFIIATPQGDTGVVPETAHLIPDFGLDIYQEFFIKTWIMAAGEHEILPDADT